MKDALRMLGMQSSRLKEKKKKVVLSIGATDLKDGQSLQEMKRDFTKLFLFCEEQGLKPLVTTILCYDTPQIKEKADIFNGFLLKSFENVVDMRKVMQYGLAEAMTSLNKK